MLRLPLLGPYFPLALTFILAAIVGAMALSCDYLAGPRAPTPTPTPTPTATPTPFPNTQPYTHGYPGTHPYTHASAHGHPHCKGIRFRSPFQDHPLV